MKVRNSFVTNSSSSSFVIFNQSEYRIPLTKDLINECIDEIMSTNEKLENKVYDPKKEAAYLKELPKRSKDYKVFEKSEIKKIAEAFHNECWSASGIYIPDEIHNVLKRSGDFSFWRSPSRNMIVEAENKLAEFCIKNRIDPAEIFIEEYDKRDDCYDYDYYDFEFQQAR